MTETHGTNNCEITIHYRNDFDPPREMRREDGRFREYLYGRRVVSMEEMRQMDPPCPPEDPN